jgi:hypothetical protein
MWSFQKFRNCDPPGVAALWSKQERWGLPVLPVTPAMVERLVLGKLFFDPAGLSVVCKGDSLLGFVHAGFGPDEQRTGLDLRTGVICALCLDPELATPELAEGLLQTGEEYLVGRGAQQIFVGGSFFPEPFWAGLCQGGRLPGVPAEHHLLREVLESHGYRPVARREIFEVSLVGFAPPVNPDLIRIRRHYRVFAKGEPELRDWWELVTIGNFELEWFELRNIDDNQRVGWMRLVLHEGAGQNAIPTGASVWDLSVAEICNAGHLEVFLLAQVARELSVRGIGWMAFLCESQALNGSGQGRPSYVCNVLETRSKGEGIVYWRELS